jgi:subtilisin family serine protease
VGGEPFVAAMNADYHDRIGHGTDCITRILDVAPGAEIYPVRIFGDELDASPEQLVSALEWAGRTGARIVNLSLGTERPNGLSAIHRACQRLVRKGVVVVAAGGRRAGWSVPAVFPDVLGVAAGEFASLREYHFDSTRTLEIVADGSARSSRSGRSRCTTSMATATASGILALLLASHPRSNVKEARELLLRHRVAERATRGER